MDDDWEPLGYPYDLRCGAYALKLYERCCGFYAKSHDLRCGAYALKLYERCCGFYAKATIYAAALMR